MGRYWGRVGLAVAMAAAVATVVATGIAFLSGEEQTGPSVRVLDTTTTTDVPATEAATSTTLLSLADTTAPAEGGECPPQLLVDVDGDGVADAAALQIGLGVTLVVCAATGERYELDVAGMGEVFAAHDFGGDGRVELMPGGTSVLAAFYDVHTFDPELAQLVEVSFEDGTPLLLVDGWDAGQGHAFGCPEEAPDQVRILTVDFDELGAAWTVTTVSIVGTMATAIGTETGVENIVPPDGQEPDALADPRFTALVGECSFIYG